MKKTTLLFATLLCGSSMAFAEDAAPENLTTKYIVNSDFSTDEGWTKHDSGGTTTTEKGNIGTLVVNSIASTTDETHTADMYCLGVSARWDTNFSSWQQTTTASLPAGDYILTFDVENPGNSVSYNMTNLTYVQVGKDMFYDGGMTAAKLVGATAWTEHYIVFSVSEASPITISFGYKNDENMGGGNPCIGGTPDLFISNLKLDKAPATGLVLDLSSVLGDPFTGWNQDNDAVFNGARHNCQKASNPGNEAAAEYKGQTMETWTESGNISKLGAGRVLYNSVFLPAGKYTFKAAVQTANQAAGSIAADAEVYFYAGSAEVKAASQALKYATVEVEVAKAGDVEYGIKYKAPALANWAAIGDISVTTTSYLTDVAFNKAKALDVLTAEVVKAKAQYATYDATAEYAVTFKAAIDAAEAAAPANVEEANVAIGTLQAAAAVAEKAYLLSIYANVEAGEYYIKNVGSGQFLGGANDWGTHASITHGGQLMTIARNADNGKYTIDTNIANNDNDHYVGGNGYLDSGKTEVEFIAQEDGTVAIRLNGKYYTAGQDTKVDWTSETVTDAAKWVILTQKDIKDAMATATAEAPVDVTSLIYDYSFGRNNRYGNKWQGDPVKGGPNEDMCAEKFNCNYDVYQTIEGMPAGKYILMVQGFYRAGNPGDLSAANDVRNAILYANANERPLVSILSEVGNVKEGGDYAVGKLPNSMVQASANFSAGLYDQSLEFILSKDGDITIGIKKTEHIGGDWTIFDNFRLVYCGPANEGFVLNDGANTIDLAEAKPEDDGYTYFCYYPAKTGQIEIVSENVFTYNDGSALKTDINGVPYSLMIEGDKVLLRTKVDDKATTIDVTINALDYGTQAHPARLTGPFTNLETQYITNPAAPVYFEYSTKDKRGGDLKISSVPALEFLDPNDDASNVIELGEGAGKYIFKHAVSRSVATVKVASLEANKTYAIQHSTLDSDIKYEMTEANNWGSAVNVTVIPTVVDEDVEVTYEYTLVGDDQVAKITEGTGAITLDETNSFVINFNKDDDHIAYYNAEGERVDSVLYEATITEYLNGVEYRSEVVRVDLHADNAKGSLAQPWVLANDALTSSIDMFMTQVDEEGYTYMQYVAPADGMFYITHIAGGDVEVAQLVTVENEDGEEVEEIQYNALSYTADEMIKEQYYAVKAGDVLSLRTAFAADEFKTEDGNWEAWDFAYFTEERGAILTGEYGDNGNSEMNITVEVPETKVGIEGITYTVTLSDDDEVEAQECDGTITLTYNAEDDQAQNGAIMKVIEYTVNVTVKYADGYEAVASETYVVLYPLAVGIDGINADQDAVIYNIAGQRLNKAAKGINIINGKKVVKK